MHSAPDNHFSTVDSSAAVLMSAAAELNKAPEAEERKCCSRLEGLPPEIRRQLLSHLSLPLLKTLVHASPIFHKQYLHDRRYLLCQSLEETLGSVTVDACALRHYAAQATCAEQDIAGHLGAFFQRTARQCIPLTNRLTQDEAVDMAMIYIQFIKPITEHYACWLLQNLDREKGEETANYRKKELLSSPETTRVTRAIYRFQLLCCTASPTGNATLRSQRTALLAFLNALEPWEIEELFSFYQFVQDVYDKIFDQVYMDLHPDNPQFDEQGRPPTPEGAFDLTGGSRDIYLEGTVLNGLPLLHTVLFKIKDHSELVSTMQQQITSSYIPFNAKEGMLGETQQALQRLNHSSERDRMQDRQVPFPFRGDGDPGAPPLAWTMVWKNTYSNLYGWYLPDEMRRWGYVFWDAATLEGAGGREILERQWEEFWEGDDPRGYLM